jgi:pyridoxine kinase
MPAAISVSSQVARGFVGNSAAIPALQRLGIEARGVPTVVLDHHPGHGPPSPLTVAPQHMELVLRSLARPGWAGEAQLVLSGYMPTTGHVEAVGLFLTVLGQNGGRALYCCDPILGDDGRLYVDPAIVPEIRDELVPRADVVTPNAFELALLTGMAAGSLTEIVAAARALARPLVAVTSAPGRTETTIGVVLVADGGAWLVETRRLTRAPHGTGDLFAALLAGRLVRGEMPLDATARAMASLHDVLVETAELGRDELALIEAQDRLVAPVTLPLVSDLAG